MTAVKLRNWLPITVIATISLAVTVHYAWFTYDYSSPNAKLVNDSWQEYAIYTKIINHLPSPIAGDTGIMSSALTTTRLPALIQQATHLDSEFVFRYFSIPFVIWLPIVIYLIARKFVSNYTALVASLLFILQPTFRGAPAGARIVIAELFMALCIYIIISKPKLRYSIPLLITLAIAITITHYSTAFITVPFMLGWIGMMVLRRQPFIIVGIFLVCVTLSVVYWHHVIVITTGYYAGKMIDDSIPYLLSPYATAMTTLAREGDLLGMFANLSPLIILQTLVIWFVELTTLIGLVINFRKYPLLVGAAITSVVIISTGYWLPPVIEGYGLGRILFYCSPILLVSSALTIQNVVLAYCSRRYAHYN